MKFVLSLSIILISVVTFGQQRVNYFRLEMGPKNEFHKSTLNPNVSVLPHIDVGAGLFIGKNFTSNVCAELGLVKNDYSARFNINTEDASYYNGFVYPTFSSYQITALVGMQKNISESFTVYSKLGVGMFLSKKLSREGVNQELPEERVDADGNVLGVMNLTTYSNGFEGGNILFRADIGGYKWINNSLGLSFSISGKISTLPLNSFAIDFAGDGIQGKNVVITNNGASVGLNLGIIYDFSK